MIIINNNQHLHGALQKNTAPYKIIDKNEARQKYKQTANIGTNVFSATVWRQEQIPPLSTELATHSKASERRQRKNDHQLFFWSMEPSACSIRWGAESGPILDG